MISGGMVFVREGVKEVGKRGGEKKGSGEEEREVRC